MGTGSSLFSHINRVINKTLAIFFPAGWKLTRFVSLSENKIRMALFFFNIGIPCKSAQDCAKRFLWVNYFHLYENNPVGQQMQKGEWSLWGVAGKFWSWVVLQKHKNFCFCFLFSTDMLPNRHNDQVLLHQTQGEKRKEKQESRQTRPIYTVCIVFSFPQLGFLSARQHDWCWNSCMWPSTYLHPKWIFATLADALLLWFIAPTASCWHMWGSRWKQRLWIISPWCSFGVSASQFEPQTW